MRRSQRVLVLGVLAGALALAAAPAQAQGELDPECTPNYLTGEACQGPDTDPAANKCNVQTWVQKASCTVTVADGETTRAGTINWGVSAERDQEASYHVVLRTPAGQVLYEKSESGGHPARIPFVAPHGLWTHLQNNTVNQSLPKVSTNTVICEIAGTHTMFGALGDLAPLGTDSPHNQLNCDVE